MAAISYGTYAGINHAIKDAPDKALPVVHMAGMIRNEMTVLSVIRVHALLDRDAQVGLQTVKRFLKMPDALDRVVAIYSADEPPQLRESAVQTCRASIATFQRAYDSIDWKVFGRLQAYRNGAIAHISIADVKALITYNQLQRLVRLCGRLSREVSMMTSGLNTWPEDDMRDAADNARRLWIAIFAGAANDAADG
ncbi:MAG: hypothetical protein ACTHOP_03175 [Mesorhizobium sp.]